MERPGETQTVYDHEESGFEKEDRTSRTTLTTSSYCAHGSMQPRLQQVQWLAKVFQRSFVLYLFEICSLYRVWHCVQHYTNGHEVISYEKLCRRYRTDFSHIACLLQQRHKYKFLVFVLLLQNMQSSSFSRYIHF